MANAIKQRTVVGEIEILRSLGFLAVVLQHVIGIYVRSAGIPFAKATILGVGFNLVKFGVPTFVFITGLVLLFNYTDNFHFTEFFRKRTLKILTPYLFWSLIYDIYYHGIPSLGLDWLKAISMNILLGKSAYHLWYVVLIFQIYLFYPCFLALFRKIRAGSLSPILILITFGIANLVLMWFSSSYIPKGLFNPDSRFLQAFVIKYRDRNLLFWMYYFILGGIAGIMLKQWRQFLQHYFKWILVAFLGFLTWVNYELLHSGVVNLSISTTLKPSMFFYTLASIMLVYILSVKIFQESPRLAQVMTFIGKYSFVAYLVHAMVLNYSARFLRFIGVAEPLLASLTAFLLCATISVLVAYGMSLLGKAWYSGKNWAFHKS